MICEGGPACPLRGTRVQESDRGFRVVCAGCGAVAHLPWTSKAVGLRNLLSADEILDWYVDRAGIWCPSCATLSTTSEGTNDA